ncbi:hypothetical protein [Paenibacillus sp. Marseille-Q9583]
MAEKKGITEDEASAIILNDSGANNRSSLESREAAAHLNTFRTVTKMLDGINKAMFWTRCFVMASAGLVTQSHLNIGGLSLF